MKSSSAIEALNLSKKYRLGTIGMTSLREDISRWWNKRNGSKQTVDFSKKLEIEDTRMINEHEFWALDNLNFTIPRGEVVGIIGANGSGKSTLLKILSRITEPTKGEVKVRGKVASLLEVGTGFHPELTGRENVYVNGAILGMTRKEVDRKFDEIVDFSGVGDFIETPIKRYSSGMTIRLGFAVAAHLDPDILIVDEVLAVGDASFQKKCLGKMEDISTSGKSIIFVSHNMASVESICKTAFHLKLGKIKNTGPTSPIIHEYLEESSPQKSQDLTFRTDRSGTGEIIIQNIEFNDSKGLKINTCRTGSFISFKCDFKSKMKTSKKLIFCLSISDSRGVRVTQMCSHFVGYEIKQDSSFSLNFNIEKLNFQPGLYYFNTYLEGDGEPMDWVINAFDLVVEQGDFYGSGMVLREGQGNTLIPFSMK
jgi:lipopolysaccharide transport system ATP-binding protein